MVCRGPTVLRYPRPDSARSRHRHFSTRLRNMSNLATPFASPIWQALARETDLAAQLICSGANEIGRADYTNIGRYATAQFGFANGLERLGKLVLTSDSLLAHGQPLSDKDLRAKGHSLSQILDESEMVQIRRSITPQYPRPNHTIAANVLASLDDFAAAGRGRYANHASLLGQQSPYEPTRTWWKNVCEPILIEHYLGTEREQRAIRDSGAVGQLLDQMGIVLHFHEDGSIITDPSQASLMTHERDITQKWGRFYSLLHARWLAELFADLTRVAGYTPGLEFFFGHYERLATFRVPDSFLRTRRTWPL